MLFPTFKFSFAVNIDHLPWYGMGNISIILFFSNAKTEINDQEVLLIQININFLFISSVGPELEVETSKSLGENLV